MGMFDQRVYLDVLVEFMPDGTMLPKIIRWQDGSQFEINKVVRVTPGSRLDQYNVVVDGHARVLYFERIVGQTRGRIGRWYVSTEKPMPQQKSKIGGI